MPKVARCKDTGLNCEFIMRGETEEELLENAGEHANAAHPTRFSQGPLKALASMVRGLGGAGGSAFTGDNRRRDWLAKVSEAAQDE